MHIFLIMNETYNNTIRDIISKMNKKINKMKIKYGKSFKNIIEEKVRNTQLICFILFVKILKYVGLEVKIEKKVNMYYARN